MRSLREGLPAFRDRTTYREPRNWPTAVIPLFVAVAVLGYVAGHSRSDHGASEAVQASKSAHVLIEYPAGWKPISVGARIPGLTISHAQVIVPSGRAAQAGLIVGTLPAGELGPLPKQFVSGLSQLPATAVVNLTEGQAYRYAQLSGEGLQEPLTIFVIPNPGGAPTGLACYATSQASPYMRACEQTVSSVTTVGQSQLYQLTPERDYAAQISAAITPLDQLRVALKRELQPQVSAARAQQLADRLGAGFATAAAALSHLEPSAPAQQVQTALSESIQQAQSGYSALADAAAQRSVSAYTTAQKRIARAEAQVDWALENYVLLGYSSTLGQPAAPQS